MNKSSNKLLKQTIATITLGLTIAPSFVSAQAFNSVSANVLASPSPVAQTIQLTSEPQSVVETVDPTVLQTTTQPTEVVSCIYQKPAQQTFDGKFLAIRRKAQVAPGEIFKVQVFVQNISNSPWFSDDSGCSGVPLIRLGTDKNRDRESPFYNNLQTTEGGWISKNRIKLDQKMVYPSQVASFTFEAKAPTVAGVYREYYAPVVEGVAWLEKNALASTDIAVGGAQLNAEKRELLSQLEISGNLSTLDIKGEKNLVVDLSEQKMYVKIGSAVIKTFRVSSGAPSHPTPPGNYTISLKQPVRVAASRPHYIMPLFQMFRSGGYGIHALPSLANDRGVFWREALNHIGTRRSHGCIRLLPDDAKYVWNFTDVGTKMSVIR